MLVCATQHELQCLTQVQTVACVQTTTACALDVRSWRAGLGVSCWLLQHSSLPLVSAESGAAWQFEVALLLAT